MYVCQSKSSFTYHLHKCQDNCMSACGASGCMKRCISFTYHCTCISLRICMCVRCVCFVAFVACVRVHFVGHCCLWSFVSVSFALTSGEAPHFAPLCFTFPFPPATSIYLAFNSYSLSPTPVVNIFRSCRSRSGRPHDMVGAVASLLISLQFAFSTLSLVSAALKLCSPFRSDLALYYLSHYSLSLLCYCCN